jgi:hypothetical protein
MKRKRIYTKKIVASSNPKRIGCRIQLNKDLFKLKGFNVLSSLNIS